MRRLLPLLCFLVACEESDDPLLDGDGGSGDGGSEDGGSGDVGAGDGGTEDGGSGDGGAEPELVTLAFTGEVVTVSGNPLGFDDSVRNLPVSGSFSYDLAVADGLPDDPERAIYDHRGSGAFRFELDGMTVTGSGSNLTEVQDFGASDVWRFVDGPQLGDDTPRVMAIDGVEVLELELWVSLSFEEAFSSDAQPDPFPAFQRNDVPHTFSLQDAGGTLLMQLDELVQE